MNSSQKSTNFKFSKLTYRQYLALSIIFSKYILKKEYPSVDELKQKIEFDTDRMLEITLKALNQKGFLEYFGDLNYKINENALKHSERFVDPLLLIDNYYDVKKLIRETKTKNKKNFDVDISTKFVPIPNFFTNDSLRKLNGVDNIFHRWYTYLADFPNSLVFTKFKEYGITSTHLVYDPFCGSGTTLVTSKLLGIDSIGFDVNPIPAFVSKIKTTWNIDIDEFKKTASKILLNFKNISSNFSNIRLENDLVHSMGYIEFHQWLKPKTQNDVILMRELISRIKTESIKDLFKLALIESATESSNASFCPGTSFYPFRKKPEFYDAFKNKLQTMAEDLIISKNIKKIGTSKVFTDDCRKSSKFIKPHSVDFIFTSPPYPNDMEYTRQTRLDLFLLDYVNNLNDVQKIKRNMIKGSTKLIFKESNSCQHVENNQTIQNIANDVATNLKGKEWGWDYPRMIREYFGDMHLSLQEFHKVLKPGSFALLVVGDQTCKNILIPVGKILGKMALDIGFSTMKLELFRERRSTLHTMALNEEILILKA
jgi:DNA modification methylase